MKFLPDTTGALIDAIGDVTVIWVGNGTCYILVQDGFGYNLVNTFAL